MTDRGRTTHVPARGKKRKKPGSILHRPPPHRPLLAGAYFNCSYRSVSIIFFKSFLPSERKKEPKPKVFGPDIFRWGRGLPQERVGAKKFDTSLETREIKLFGRDIPGFCRDIPGAREKFEKKVCVQFPFPIPGSAPESRTCKVSRILTYRGLGVVPASVVRVHEGRTHQIS